MRFVKKPHYSKNLIVIITHDMQTFALTLILYKVCVFNVLAVLLCAF